MKVAFVSYDFPEYCVRHANEMANEADVLLLLPMTPDCEDGRLIAPNVRYEPIGRPRYRQPTKQLSTIWKIVRSIKKFDPDVIHFQNGHLFFNLALPLLKRYPKVITIHDARQHLGDKEANITPQRIMDFGFKQADRVIVHGRSLIPTVSNELGFSENKIHLIPHIAIGQRDEVFENKDDGRTVLFFGRIWEYKGLDYLIRAEPKVSAVFPDVKFVIGGRGDDFDQYRKQMVHPDRFEVHNDWITDEMRTEMFARASVVTLPYIEASQSGVIPIAYNHAKPVIATTIGGLPDAVEHGKTGLLVPPRDADSLADAIIQLLRDEDLRKEMGDAGKQRLDVDCSPHVVVDQTLDVYRQTIADRGGKLTPVVPLTDSTSRASGETKDNPLTSASDRLHQFLVQNQVRDGRLVGPDPGVRFNYRFWRFGKGLFPNKNWGDDLVYMQAQGYWILANWLRSNSPEDESARLAEATSQHVIAAQRTDGGWDYPNREWAGRVATVEGIWASLGLMESYRKTERREYLEAVLRWHEFFEREVGYQDFDGMTAVNYFANEVSEPVPNNSALTLRYLAELSNATGDSRYLSRCENLLQFISTAQMPTGEIPYVYNLPKMKHFQCFQYQAFTFLDVLRYFQLTSDANAKRVLQSQAKFLSTGITQAGYARYECGNDYRTVNYHTMAVSTALSLAADHLDSADFAPVARRGLNYVLALQSADGSWPHSRGDYRVLADIRKYPRYLAMMLYHMLSVCECRSNEQPIDQQDLGRKDFQSEAVASAGRTS